MTVTSADLIEPALARTVAAWEANASSLSNIMRVLRRLPYSSDDVRLVSDAIASWHAKGRLTYLGPLLQQFRVLGMQERASAIESYVERGLLFVSSVDHQIEMLMVKVDGGQGLFGRQKYHHACYLRMDGDENYQPIGTAKTIIGALTKVGVLYRA